MFDCVNLKDPCDFALPYDVFTEFYRIPSTDYKLGWIKIKRNIFIDYTLPILDENHECECMETEYCEDDSCINRCLYIECSPMNCTPHCKNQRMRHFEHLKEHEIDIRFNLRKGWSLHTLVACKRGEFLLEYTGEWISQKLFEERSKDLKTKSDFYFLQVKNDAIIDASFKGSEARFANHSCDPNCHIEIWTVDSEKRVGVFASRDIQPNEELSYNYNFDSLVNYSCFCGSQNCTGTLGKGYLSKFKVL